MQVGDQVRIEKGYYHGGQVGVIIACNGHHDDYRVSFDGDNKWWYGSKLLTIVDPNCASAMLAEFMGEPCE